MSKIRGTQSKVEVITVDKDTVYIRDNITRVEEEDFTGWEYEEKIYNKDTYIGMVAYENETLKDETVINMFAMTEMFEKNIKLELDNDNTMLAIIELYEMVGGM